MKLSLTHPLAVAGAFIALTGSASAATLYWFNTRVDTAQSGNVISARVADCPSVPPSQAKAVGMKVVPNYSYSAEYRINKPGVISEQQILEAIQAKCEQRAIAASIDNHFPDMTEFSATKLAPNSKGLYSPVYKPAVVDAFDGESVTLSSVSGLASTDPNGAGQPVGTKTTISVASDALLTKAGKPVTTLAKGDAVYIAYQNRAIVGETPDPYDAKSYAKVHDLGPDSVIRGVGVLTTNQDAIRLLEYALSSGAITGVKEDPALG